MTAASSATVSFLDSCSGRIRQGRCGRRSVDLGRSLRTSAPKVRRDVDGRRQERSGEYETKRAEKAAAGNRDDENYEWVELEGGAHRKRLDDVLEFFSLDVPPSKLA